MKICIVGWYGTETIGDRAILAGIISFLGECTENKEIQINLGALYPFFTKRMIVEDISFWEKITKKKIKINLFNSKLKKELQKNIENSDMVIMGGGPIMHILPLYMIEYAFEYAKKLNKKTGIIGSGIGPLFYEEYKKSTINIVKNSDVVILRDNKSKTNLINIFNEYNEKLNAEDIETSYDPAVKCALEYQKHNIQKTGDRIVVNLRSFPSEYSEDLGKKDIINNQLKNFLKKLTDEFSEKEILLVPMHYFSIGDDDRDFFNEIKLTENFKDNLKVQNKILTLEETLEVFMNSEICIGMRFHSVVLQTILSKNNYILDYTEPKKGKIIGFISDIDKDLKFYKDRYVNLQNVSEIDQFDFQKIKLKNKFEYSITNILEHLEVYSTRIREVLNENTSH